ncbi:MAG: DUF4347 domain-containing protein, partial [Beijerinckiaceae bacterium]
MATSRSSTKNAARSAKTKAARGLAGSPVQEMAAIPAMAPMIEALEPRLVFDGAIDATLDQKAEPVDCAACVDIPGADESTALPQAAMLQDQPVMQDSVMQEPQRQEIVFIDYRVADADVIIAAFPPGTEVHLLDASRDGVEQIAATLSGRVGIDAIHIVSHGRSGTLDLGDTKLTEASIAGKHADEIAVIRAALDVDADLLLYGCDFAAGSRGASAVAALSAATGADVAASEDLTGASQLGGDWLLESTTGAIEATSLVSADYDHTLWTASASAAGWFGDTPPNTPNASAVGNGLASAGPILGGPGVTLSNVTLAGGTTAFQVAGVDATSTTIDAALTNGDYISSILVVGAEAIRISALQFNQRSENPTAARLGIDIVDVTENVRIQLATNIIIDGTANSVVITPTALPILQEGRTYELRFLFFGSTANMFIDNPSIRTQINEAPVAVNDSLAVTVGSLTSIDLTTNDTDVDADALFVTQINGSAITAGVPVVLASGTTLTLQADGTINATKVGAAAENFTYQVTDLQGHTATASATLTAAPAGLNDLDIDGIVDATDVDDDNDGILDSVEGLNAVGTTGTWTIAGNIATSSLGNGITARITKVSPNAFTNDVFNPAGAGFWSSALENTASLSSVANWGDSFTVAFLDAAGNAVFVDNPILHLDRLGGLDGSIGNGATFTLQGGLTWTELAGTDDFRTSSTTVRDAGAGLPVAPGFLTESTQADATGTAAGSLRINGRVSTFTLTTNQTGPNGSGADGIEFKLQAAAPSRDTDADGKADYRDIDSDDDGITDTIEAQTTTGFIAPSGVGIATTDSNNDGLDDVYDPGALGTAGGIGLTPVNTDGTTVADYIDTDSDNDGINDRAENGLGVAQPAANAADTDGDGLK